MAAGVRRTSGQADAAAPPARMDGAALGLALACLCLGAASLTWVWTAGGRRFTVLPVSPTATCLLAVTMEEEEQGCRVVESVVAQGRVVPLEAICRTRTEKAVGDQLSVCGMCVGVIDPEKVAAAEGSANHQRLVRELDGAAVHSWNETVRQQRTFTKQLEGVGKNRWKSALHAASESATRTVRAENCTGLVTFGHGEKFSPVCAECMKVDGMLRSVQSERARDAREEADPERNEQREERRIGVGSRTRHDLLSAEEKLKRDRRARQFALRLKRKIDVMEKAQLLREVEGVELPSAESEGTAGLTANDMRTIVNDPAVQAAATSEFSQAGGDVQPQHEVAAALWADSAKYAKLADGRGAY